MGTAVAYSTEGPDGYAPFRGKPACISRSGFERRAHEFDREACVCGATRGRINGACPHAECCHYRFRLANVPSAAPHADTRRLDDTSKRPSSERRSLARITLLIRP